MTDDPQAPDAVTSDGRRIDLKTTPELPKGNDSQLALYRRTAPREAPEEMRQRIVAIIGPDIERMHLEHVRLAVQERLHKELGVVVVFQQEPMPPVKIEAPPIFDLMGDQPRVEERPKKSTIPIPNHRRKWWER